MRSLQTTPRASIASATLTKPAILAPEVIDAVTFVAVRDALFMDLPHDRTQPLILLL